MSDPKADDEKNSASHEAIFNTEAEVMTNKALVYQSRAIIEENRHMILSNYAAAFIGNRQLANQNTDDIFRNRELILRQHISKSALETSFIEAQLDLAKLEFLEHRSQLNSSVLTISEKMEKINQLLTEANQEIMAANQSIVSFNRGHIDHNNRLLNGDLTPSMASQQDTKKALAAVKKLMKHIATSALNNRKRMQKLVKASLKNSTALIKNKNEIAERRDEIMENRDAMTANRRKMFK